MKFLVDAQLPPALVGWLNRRHVEADHVFALGLGSESDATIATYAETNHFIVVSKDADFLTLRSPDRFGVVWLRCGNSTTRALLIWLEPRWSEIATLLRSGERLVEVR